LTKIVYEGSLIQQHPTACPTCSSSDYSDRIESEVLEEEVYTRETIEQWQTTADNGCFTCATVVNGSLQILSALYPGEMCTQLTIEKALSANDQSQAFGNYKVSLRFFRQTMDFKELLIVKFYTRDSTVCHI
jgi:hypothetical protein